MVIYRLLADATVVAHFAYASFIVVGLVLILLGMLRGWSWIRNFWFRLSHLLMMGIVAAEACFGIPCPLTNWENALRVRAGQATYPGSFIGTLVNEALFVEVPEWVLSVGYVLFFGLIILTIIMAPPRWPGWRRAAQGAERSETGAG